MAKSSGCHLPAGVLIKYPKWPIVIQQYIVGGIVESVVSCLLYAVQCRGVQADVINVCERNCIASPD